MCLLRTQGHAVCQSDTAIVVFVNFSRFELREAYLDCQFKMATCQTALERPALIRHFCRRTNKSKRWVVAGVPWKGKGFFTTGSECLSRTIIRKKENPKRNVRQCYNASDSKHLDPLPPWLRSGLSNYFHNHKCYLITQGVIMTGQWTKQTQQYQGWPPQNRRLRLN